MRARSAVDRAWEPGDVPPVEARPPRRRYLLFAGGQGTPGGLQDLVGLFDDEAAARSAFTLVRLSSEHRAAWAELGAVDSNGNVRLLCWFGRDRATPVRRRLRQPALGSGGAPGGSTGRPPPLGRRWPPAGWRRR